MHDPEGWESPGSDLIDFTGPAFAYAERGWRVLPLYPGEKRPAVSDWPTRASTDPHQVADWWTQCADYNIGIATGRGSGFWVLDIDPKSDGDKTLAALEAEHGALPVTRTHRTGSGGTHYLFSMPEGFVITNSPGALKGTGIDVRGEGGQIVAPPSVTALGAYTLKLDVPIAPAPDWLLDLLRPRTELHVVGGTDVAAIHETPPEERDRYADYAATALRAACAEVAGATAGGRNQVLNNQVLAVAGIAAHDPTLVDRDDVYEGMLAACTTNGLIDDDGKHSFRQTFQSAWSAGLTKPRAKWPPPAVSQGLFFTATHRSLPIVNVSSRKLNELVDQVLDNIADANDDDPTLFAHGSEVVKVVGQPARTAALDSNLVAYEADARMHFRKQQPRGGDAVAQCPARVVDTIMSMPVKPFPVLTRLSYTPYFSPSGRYVDEPGYDREARTYYSPAPGLSVPEIPAEPTSAQVFAALDFIASNLFVDFMFVSPADRAHALALMLLPFVRDMIDGPTPLHNIEAPTPGSGKGLLMKVLLLPAVGGRHVTTGPAADNEEWEKRLVTFLRLSPQALVLDNVNDKVTSGFLCSALTEPEVSSRLLGVSQQVTIPVRTTWVMTANNPKFSDEVARRTLRIRLDAQVERPEDRTGFKHSDLLSWSMAHRGELIAACCTLVRGWISQGAPEAVPAKPFGSFEHWHSVMGGLLDYLGIEGLLANKEEFLTASDDESIAWNSLVALLRQAATNDLSRGEWTSGEIADIVQQAGIAIDLGRNESSKALMMGRELAKQRDRWHDGQQFAKRMVNGKTLWHLIGKPSL